MAESVNRIMVKETFSRTYIIRMSRDITEADDFEDEFQVLAQAGPNDLVQIIINSDGGKLATALLLCKAIRECEAHTIAYIGFTCASAATVVALACDEWEMDENSSFMLHTATYGVYGKGNEIAAQSRHMEKMINRVQYNVYAGFLTQDEITSMIEGKDFWIEGEELAARLTAYAEYRIALQEAIELDIQQEAE